MATLIETLYEQQIKPLPQAEQLRLVELIARGIADATESATPAFRDLMELHGLGAEVWQGIDAQEYVNQLRREWDLRP